MTDPPPVPNEQARAYLAGQAPTRPFWERDVSDLRREYREEAVTAGGDPEPVERVEQVMAAGVPARLYRPAGGSDGVLVWLHGGAWMVGDLESYDTVVRAIANRAQCAVLSVDYRLAPEHPYPAAIEDAWAATEWAAARCPGLAVGGDSAGGNLAAAVALRARDSGLAIALQLLIYAVLDCRADSPSYDAYRRRYGRFAGIEGFGGQRQEEIRHIWEIYVPEPTRRGERDASPLRAPSLRGVAPALIISAEHDILRRESEDYARRLQANGIPVELVGYEGQVHNFFLHLATMKDARDAVDRSAQAVRTALARVTRTARDCAREASSPTGPALERVNTRTGEPSVTSHSEGPEHRGDR